MKLEGLVAATHTPFASDGDLDLAVVEKQAEHLLRNRVTTVFIGGTTGESHSLMLEERLDLAQRWGEVIRGTPMRLVVHVGSNCLADSQTLAAQAQSLGATAISALAPSYFKPKDTETLVACCQQIAEAAPALPFYFYDIPSMTGVHVSLPEFLSLAAERIPTLAGAKFTNPDLASYQRCLHLQGGRFDIPWGTDESLLAALAVGATNAVGSTYNFAAPIYHRLLAAFAKGDFDAAQKEQFRSVELVALLARFGFMGAAKEVTTMLGVSVGSPRLPNIALSGERVRELRASLATLGFFGWIEEEF
jgi:N-acetylneuraminate lyase